MSYIKMLLNWIVSIIRMSGKQAEIDRILRENKETQDAINKQLQEDHRVLKEKVNLLELQFQHLDKHLDKQLGGIDAELSKVRDRLLNHEFEDIKAREDIHTNIKMIDFKLDTVLEQIRQTRQNWAGKSNEPDVQRLLDTLQAASTQIGVKRRSINRLLEKLPATPKKQ